MADNTVTKIEDMDEFRRRENLFRTDPAARADMINQLANVGGGTAENTTNNTMDRLLSNDVMAQFSLKGNRGKLNFSITEIYSMLREAIIRASGASVNEVEDAMKEHLHQAPGAEGNAFHLEEMWNALDGVAAPVDNVTRIEDMDQFRRRENLFRTSHAARDNAINKLAEVGGGTAVDTTNNTMDRLLSNGMMAQFNFRRATRDYFSATEIYSVLKEAIIRASGASVNEVEDAMKKHLRQAPGTVGDTVTKIEDMDEFRRRENLFRTDPVARADAVRQLENCGDAVSPITKRIMSRLLSNGMMAQFSFRGATRANFSATEIYSMLKEAIIRASEAPESEVKAAMKVYLNNAQRRADS